MLEQFFRDRQYTIAGLSAFGTLAAVVVSLLLAFLKRREHRTKLGAWATMTAIFHDTVDPNNRPRYLSVDITNKGIMPLRIPFSFFRWRAPFKRGFFMVNPHDGYGLDEWIAQKQYPVEIAPRAAQTFFVSSFKMFFEELPKMMTGPDPVSPWQFRHLRAVVRTDDGMIFRVKISKDIRAKLREMSRRPLPNP